MVATLRSLRHIRRSRILRLGDSVGIVIGPGKPQDVSEFARRQVVTLLGPPPQMATGYL